MRTVLAAKSLKVTKALRVRLEQEFDRLSKSKKLGLAFEEHIPVCTPLCGVPILSGSNLAKKSGTINNTSSVIRSANYKATYM